MIVLESQQSRRSFLRKLGGGILGVTAAQSLGKGLNAYPEFQQRCATESLPEEGVEAFGSLFASSFRLLTSALISITADSVRVRGWC